MTANQKFVDLTVQTRDEQRTGKMYAYSRVESKLSFATLFFHDGQLSNCEYNGKSGDLALSELINSEVTNVVFVAGDSPDHIRDPSIRDVDTLLTSIKHQQSDSTESANANKDAGLRDIATDALKTICGDNATNLVNDLAERYPPEENQHKFIEECVKLASNFIGDEMANEIFKPLFALRD